MRWILILEAGSSPAQIKHSLMTGDYIVVTLWLCFHQCSFTLLIFKLLLLFFFCIVSKGRCFSSQNFAILLAAGHHRLIKLHHSKKSVKQQWLESLRLRWCELCYFLQWEQLGTLYQQELCLSVLVVCIGEAVPGIVMWKTTTIMEPQMCHSHWDGQTADKYYSFYPDTLAQVLIFVSLDDIRPLCRHAAGEEELGKWTVMLILVQTSMQSFGIPYTSEYIFSRRYLKSCFQCKRIRLFFFCQFFINPEVLFLSWETSSWAESFFSFFLSSLLQCYVFHPSQRLSVVPTLLSPSKVLDVW